MGQLARGERLQIMLADDELKALDDWRFARRMPSRASAIRELLKRGLAAEGIVVTPGAHSRDFGVLEPAPVEAGTTSDRSIEKAKAKRNSTSAE